MTGEAFRIETSGAVATLTLTRPEVRNALRPVEFHALGAALAHLGRDASVRLIVLTGEGNAAFSAGLNLKDRDAMRRELERDGATGLGSVLRAAQDIRTPILGRINGACVAGGLGLLSICRHAITVDHAVFALPEIRVGLYPHVVMAGWSCRLPQGALTPLADSGTAISTENALALGLIDDIVPAADLDLAVQQFATRILTGPTLPVPERTPGFMAELVAAEARTRTEHRNKIVSS